MSWLRRLRYEASKTGLRRPLVAWRHRDIGPQDVLLASYPRSGNTWLRFLLYELLTGETATFHSINAPASAVPDLGRHTRAPALLPGNGRLIKTHEPYRPVYYRALHLVRDARDVAVSEYYFLRAYGVFTGDLDQFISRFNVGLSNGYTAWHAHTHSWLQAAGKAHCLLLRYEDVQAAPAAQLARVAAFLDVPYTAAQLAAVTAHNTFRAMQQNETAVPDKALSASGRPGRFVREGQAGGWRNTLTEAQVAQIERVMGPTLKQLGYQTVTR